MKNFLILLITAFAATSLQACSIDIGSGGGGDVKVASCSIACADKSHVEVSCPVGNIPKCECDPKPQAYCGVADRKK